MVQPKGMNMKHQGNLIIANAGDALKYRDVTDVGGHLYIDADADLPALTTVGGYLYIDADADLPALTTAHGVKGRLLCASTYGLWLGDNGLLYAGCRQGLTIDEALKHWDRPDKRAVKFTESIKKLNAK
jgi:hypothetical protein